MVDTLRVCTSIVEVGDGARVKGQKRRGKERWGKEVEARKCSKWMI